MELKNFGWFILFSLKVTYGSDKPSIVSKPKKTVRFQDIQYELNYDAVDIKKFVYRLKTDRFYTPADPLCAAILIGLNRDGVRELPSVVSKSKTEDAVCTLKSIKLSCMRQLVLCFK